MKVKGVETQNINIRHFNVIVNIGVEPAYSKLHHDVHIAK